MTALTCLVVAAHAEDELITRVWRSDDGLPGNVARSVVRSSDGFLWIATAEGIARFDGRRFDPLHLPSDLRVPREAPNRLFATSGGVVWFSGHSGGLLRIEDGEVRQVFEDGAEDARVTQIIERGNGGVIARRGEEIWRVSSTPPDLLETPESDIRTALEEDLEQRATAGRLLPSGDCGVLIDRGGRFWTRGPDGNIVTAGPDGEPMTPEIEALEGSIAVSEMLEDREGNIWVASEVSGLIRFRRSRVEVFDESDGFSDQAMIAVIEGANGDIWTGARPSGVDRLGDDGVDHFEFAPDTPGPRRPVSALYRDRDGRLWAASRGGSVFRWGDAGFEIAFPGEADPSQVDAMFEDGRGTMWFGGSRGLFRVEDGTIRSLGPSEGFPGGRISAMAGGPDGRLWFGTGEGRVFREKDGRILAVGGDEALDARRVSGLLVESPRRVWATTLGAGLHFWDGVRWRTIDERHGLPDPRLTCLVADDRGYLWLGSLGGIFRIAFETLDAHLADRTTPLAWLRLDRSDGLPTRECTGSAQPSGWRSRDGRLWFPTSRGLVRLDPGALRIDETPPPVHLREIRANARPIAKSHGVFEIAPGRARLECLYQALDLSAPGKTTYRTRLVGLDDTWREAGERRVATYEAVPPGRYRFEVMAASGDGVWSRRPAVAEIVVHPPFWKTPGFLIAEIAAVLVLASGAGWWIARHRGRKRLRDLRLRHVRETERARIARDLHDDLGASVTEISLLAGLGAEERDAPQLREALHDVSRKSRQLVSSLDEIVWAVNPREDTLRSLVEYLTTFVHEFLSGAGITPRLEVPREPPERPVESATRHAVFLAVREALNNLVRHANAGSARFAITWRDGLLGITLADDGRGFDDALIRRGHGLGNIRSRMSDCGGTCDIDSREHGGTTIRLTIPLTPSAP